MKKVMTLAEFTKKGGQYRWKGKTKAERSAHGKMMSLSRKLKVKSHGGDTTITINK